MSDDLAPLLREAADGFLAEHHSMARLRGLRDHAQGIDRAFWQAMAGQGWLGLRLPEALGGAELGLRAATVLAEHFGRHVLPEPFLEAALIPGMLVAAAPSSALRDRLAQEIVSGERIVAIATAERANALDPAEPQTRLVAQSGRLRLDGTKLFASAAADTWLVSARYRGQVALVAVARDVPGLEMTTQRMTDGSVSATLQFVDAALAEDALLLPDAGALLREAYSEATVATSAQLTGLANAALETTLDYMNQREQFGRKIGSFQALQHRAVDLRLQLELAGAAWRNALARHETAPGAPASLAAISAAKARCSDAALAVCRAAIQLHGGIGYTDDADIGLYMKSAMRLASFAGNGTAHRQRFHQLQLQAEP